MLDTGFALCHNNGPIFNKGLVYTGYSGEIRTMLDVQRAGQIPQLVNDAVNKWVYLPNVPVSHLFKTHEKMISLLGGPFQEHVDWLKVQQAGALTQVSNMVLKQNKAPWYKGSKAHSDPVVYILPNLSVKKIVRPKQHEPAWSKVL
jgi:hypothetical protein